jgi:hypothetical protein
MNRSTSRAQLTLAGAVVFTGIALCHAAALAAPTATWDQARVTGIAEKLAKAVDELYEQEYRAPESYVPGATIGAPTHHAFMDTLRQLHGETRHLASSLKKGASAEATKGSVKHVKELNDDLAEYRRMMDLENPVVNQFAALEDLIHQLTPYYGLDKKR